MGFISLDKEIKDKGVIYFDALILQETLHRKKKRAVYTPADSPFVLQITSPIFLYTSKRDIFMA